MSAGAASGDEPMDHARMDHSAMDHSAVGHGDPASPAEGSGTARLPANEGGHTGLHIDAGDDWMVMAHGFAWGVYSDQSGPRGDDKATIQSMLMLSGEKDTGWGRIQLKSMMSLEPLMSNRGYPNLFATGETAGGEPLVDRQHPHDLFMELAARVDIDVGDDGERIFLYGGPVGEPAIGPSAFMHRGSARYNPEAPITHHWFDSTHITYGVATLGYQTRTFQLEGSLFTGREPDEKRWNIETPRFDSWAVRGTWTPTPDWALQVSHARLKQPEAQHPGENEHRTTASIQYANGRGLSATAAFSAKNRDQAREIEQMVLGEQHQHGADAVIQQHCLDPLGRRNIGAVALDLVVHTEVFQQLGDQQGQFGAAFGVDSSIHKRTCCSDLPEYSEAVTRGRCGDGWLSYLAVFLAVTQPALEQWADVLRPACQQCLGGVAHRR